MSFQRDQKIVRIENGLLKAVAINGQPSVRLNLFDRMVFYHVPGISIAVIKDGKIVWKRSYGVTNAETKVPVSTETLFQAASISKTVTAVAALRTVEQGLLSLDEDVNPKLTSWKIPENKFTREKKVTLRRLLSHSAGVNQHGFEGYVNKEGVVIPSVVQILNGGASTNSNSIVVNRVPGEEFSYSGGGYTIVQQLLMDIFHLPFSEIINQAVILPVSMERSFFQQPLNAESSANACVGHRSNGAIIEGGRNIYPELAAAGLWTTPSDLAKFAIEVMNAFNGKSNRVLTQQMATEMLTVQMAPYGLGFAIEGKGADLEFYHGGGNEGFRCMLVAYPEKNAGIVIMSNSDNGLQLIAEILRSAAMEYSWPHLSAVKEKIWNKNVSPTVYDQYIGSYSEGSIILTISKVGDKIFASVNSVNNDENSEPPIEIRPESNEIFFDVEVGREIVFTKDGMILDSKMELKKMVF
ncbi:MAG: beta-lactamase family protein [Oligoflexia bacterium]|nr:beta-lactamase family protein [Oligoflexia bacterium]